MTEPTTSEHAATTAPAAMPAEISGFASRTACIGAARVELGKLGVTQPFVGVHFNVAKDDETGRWTWTRVDLTPRGKLRPAAEEHALHIAQAKAASGLTDAQVTAALTVDGVRYPSKKRADEARRLKDERAVKHAAAKATPKAKAKPAPKAKGKAAPAPKAAKAAKTPAAPAAMGKRAQADADADAGIMPAAPVFPDNKAWAGYTKKLAVLVDMATAGDLKGLKAATIPTYDSGVKAMARYRDLAVTALEAQAKARKAKTTGAAAAGGI